MHDSLDVLLHGEPTASLRRTRSDRLELQYRRAEGLSVSLSMKPRAKPYAGEVVLNWIDNLLPDDERLRSTWARDNKAASTSPFDLLATPIGEDCAGAVQFAPSEEVDRLQLRGGDAEVASIDWIEQRLAELRHAADTWQSLDHSLLMHSIGGLQPKLGLHRLDDGQWARPRGDIPTTHILKPAPRAEWSHLDLNEHICLTAARTLGVAAATTSYEHFGEQSALIVERFDRRRTGGVWRRLHAEDLCQAFGLRPDQKVEDRGGPSIRAISRLLRTCAPNAAEGDDAVRRFAQALVLNLVIVGSDAHAKNYTLVHRSDSTATLAPLYDVASNLGHVRASHDPAEYEAMVLAMRFGDGYTIGGATAPSAWRTLADELRIDRDFLTERARHFADGFGDAAQAEIARLDAAGRLDEAEHDFCARMMSRFRIWEAHLCSLPALRSSKPARRASPRADAQPPSRAIRCNQRLRHGALCNRRLRDAPCPLHPNSPGSRNIRAR
ncbi:HipA domain-containing protein [Candidatus Poriferisodalis sp.]|uniref:HipA domain-containing protein n=1 Tax=Candidatus Poriferisodalis sp. TaxID=3101277 RepID=UPI003B01FA30